MAKRRTPQQAPVLQPTPVADRGEFAMTLDGVTYRLRPSFTAISAIEEKTGMKLIPLANAGGRGDISLEHLGVIAAELIRAGAKADDESTRNVGATRIAQLCYEAGIPAALARVTACLLDAATGGRTIEGNVKEVTE
jgi:hypothetical protein